MAPVAVEVRTLVEMIPLLVEYEQQMDAVERRAHHLLEQRGALYGKALDEWLAAEHQILCLPQAQPTEDEDSFRVYTSLSGFQREHLDVVVSANDLIIRAQCEWASRDSAKLRLKAMSHYRFRDAVEPQTIQADFDKSILQVLIPKALGLKRAVLGIIEVPPKRPRLW